MDESKADADDSDEEADSSRAASSQRSRSAARTPASRQSAGAASGRRGDGQAKVKAAQDPAVDRFRRENQRGFFSGVPGRLLGSRPYSF